MSQTKTAAVDKVPLGQKAAFGAGHLVLNLLPGALGVFMFFLLTVFGMDPVQAGILGGLPRIFDAITDPVMGFIADNTSSKYGRRRPYIFVGAILSAIFFVLLWQMDETDSATFNFTPPELLQGLPALSTEVKKESPDSVQILFAGSEITVSFPSAST